MLCVVFDFGKHGCNGGYASWMGQRKRSWLTRRDKVEVFERIRREYEFGVGTIAGVSRKLGVHRRMVREALCSAEPAAPKPQQRRLRKLDTVSDFIDQILRADLSAPSKQRHTARRIFDRLRAEVAGFSGSQRSVRGYVQRRRQQLGLENREVFVPQTYEWGSEAQVDWYEAWAMLSGERVKLQVFEMRSMASGGAYHRAYFHVTQQAFLDAHQFAFAYFGGVFRTLRYDNLKSAVKKVLRGYRREETSRFIAFRSHWRFQSEFCNPARGNEKGGVEGEGGYFRRNHWVPLPEARDLDELNAYLERCCHEDQNRVLAIRLGDRVGINQDDLKAVAMAPDAHRLVQIRQPHDDGAARSACVNDQNTDRAMAQQIGWQSVFDAHATPYLPQRTARASVATGSTFRAETACVCPPGRSKAHRSLLRGGSGGRHWRE
jgi:transposase